MTIAYFDCFSGAAGDMIVAACLDAGASADYLCSELGKLGLREIDVHIGKTVKHGIAAMTFDPRTDQHEHAGGAGHGHRHLSVIVDIIDKAQLSGSAGDKAVQIFRRLAQAEAKVHGVGVEEVHFHEVGAADAIADIVGACIVLESLGVEQVYCSGLVVGGGTVRCAHGVLPVPAPATAELIKGVPLVSSGANCELLTPTGAAILTTLAAGYGPMPTMCIEAIGYGAGQRDIPDWPNVLRVLVGSSDQAVKAQSDQVFVLEANLDDATGELIGMVTERLMEAGALDVYCTAIAMKKNRPATKISVIAQPMDAGRLEHILFVESTTLGVRRQLCQRTVLARREKVVATQYGAVTMKLGILDGQVVSAAAEFEECRRLAQKHQVAVKQVIAAAMVAYEQIDND